MPIARGMRASPCTMVGAPAFKSRSREATERARAAADMAVQVAKGGDLDRFVTAFDRLADNDPYLVRAAVFLCEEAIADAQPGLLLDRMDLLDAIAAEASHPRTI